MEFGLFILNTVSSVAVGNSDDHLRYLGQCYLMDIFYVRKQTDVSRQKIKQDLFDTRRISASYFIPSGPKTTHTKLQFLFFQKWLEIFSIISTFSGKKEKQSLNPSFLRKQVKKKNNYETKQSLKIIARGLCSDLTSESAPAALVVVCSPTGCLPSLFTMLLCWFFGFGFVFLGWVFLGFFVEFFLHLGCFKLFSHLGFYLPTGAS